jgi:teichuronic acid exporter
VTQTGLRRQIVSSLRWTAIAKFGGQFVSWGITLFVIRLLVPADYGLMAMANVVIGLLAMVAEMGFGASLVQSADLDRNRIGQLFGAALVINVAFCAALFAAAPLLGSFFDEPRLIAVVRVLSFQFIIVAVGLVPDAMLRRGLRFRPLSLIEITSGICGNVLTLALAWSGKGVWSLVMGGLAAALLRSTLLHAVAHERVTPVFSFRDARQLVSFGANITLARFLWYLYTQADILVAGKVLGKEALGLYTVAVHLASLPMQRVASVVNDVAFAAFARIQNDRNAVTANVRLAVRLVALFAFPALWGLACVAPDMVRLVMGDRWLEAILPLQIVALAVPLRMVGTIVSTTTISVGRVDIAMWTTLVGTLIAPPLFYLATRFGIVGLAIVWAAVTPLMLILNLYRALPNLGLTTAAVFREMARSALAALLMALGVFAVQMTFSNLHVASRLMVEIGVGAILYLITTSLLNRATALEALRLLLPSRFERSAIARMRP